MSDRAPRNADELAAAALGVSVSHYRSKYGATPKGDGYQETDQRLRAMAAIADLNAARSIDDIDLDDAAQEDDPPAALREMVMSEAERRLRAQIAANARWAKTPEDKRREATAKARETFERRFEDEVDPDRTLDPAERARRAGHARKAYYARLALKSAKARRLRKDRSSSGE